MLAIWLGVNSLSCGFTVFFFFFFLAECEGELCATSAVIPAALAPPGGAGCFFKSLLRFFSLMFFCSASHSA